MMKQRLFPPVVLALLALNFIAADAQQTTFYVSPTGSGTDCTEQSPCSVSQMLSELSAGTTGIFLPGTYTGAVAISNKSGMPLFPITLRAETPAVDCPDPVNDPDGCAIDTSSRSILTGGIDFSGANADYWDIEGFEFDDVDAIDCDGSSIGTGPNNINIRYVHAHYEEDVGGQAFFFRYCSDITIEHSYVFNSLTGAGSGPDYGVQLVQGTRNVTLRNLYFAGEQNHHISVKRDADNITMERIVCEGWGSECVFLGQNQDDATSISGGTSCSNVQRDDGSVGTLFDHTSSNITIRRMFARQSAMGATSYPGRFGLRIANASNVDAQDIFIGPVLSTLATTAQFVHDIAISSLPEGQCGTEPGNNKIRGLIMVGDAGEDAPCMRIQGNGFSPSTLTIENAVCHNPGGGDQPAMTRSSGVDNSSGAWESTSAPTTVYRNYVHNDCSTSFSGTSGTLTQSHGTVFNCGTSPGGTGVLTVDPQFTGPETVPVAQLNFNHGTKLWDWPNRYDPIINQYRAQNAALTDAGTGTAAPCTGTACDIGINEFFVGLSSLWQSCAAVNDGDPVQGGAAPPWISGLGLIVHIDCNAKLIVIGACSDPLDETKCDQSVYIRKQAHLQIRDTQPSILLEAGTVGGDTDESGDCWRTRAVYDFSALSLEELTGIWVSIQRDVDGGTHDCTASPPSPFWAWQAHRP